jgi:hypothetical protein
MSKLDDFLKDKQEVKPGDTGREVITRQEKNSPVVRLILEAIMLLDFRIGGASLKSSGDAIGSYVRDFEVESQNVVR